MSPKIRIKRIMKYHRQGSRPLHLFFIKKYSLLMLFSSCFRRELANFVTAVLRSIRKGELDEETIRVAQRLRIFYPDLPLIHPKILDVKRVRKKSWWQSIKSWW